MRSVTPYAVYVSSGQRRGATIDPTRPIGITRRCSIASSAVTKRASATARFKASSPLPRSREDVMRASVYWKEALAVATSLFVSSSSLAADNCTGYDVLVTQSAETSDLGKGHSVTIVSQSSLLITDDAPIYNLVSGTCQGSLLTTPDGKTRGSGHCARRDKDGDTVSIEWSPAPGAQRICGSSPAEVESSQARPAQDGLRQYGQTGRSSS